MFEKGLRYIDDILLGTIVANKYIKAQYKSFKVILECDDPNYYFDTDCPGRFLNFCKYLKLSKDKYAGKPIVLDGFQIAFIMQLFGVKRRDNGERRYSNIYMLIGRKAGKSTLLSAIGLYAITKDKWCSKGGEIYTAATKREQAKIVYSEMQNMVRQSPALQKRLKVTRDAIFNPNGFGKIVPLASDVKSLDGLNPSLSICDELSAHPNGLLYSVLKSAMGSRTCPLLISITTAGLNPEGFGVEISDYAKKVALGTIKDDAFLPIVYCLEEDDIWDDEKNWIKANPGLGTIKSIDDMRKNCNEAQNMPTSKTEFLIKHLNLFTREKAEFLSITDWESIEHVYDIFDADFKKNIQDVFLGIDLASVSDMCSLSGVCVMKDGSWKAFSFNYLPEAAVDKAIIKGNSNYREWAATGKIQVTEGNITDYEYLKHDFYRICEGLPVNECAFDKYNSSQLITDLSANSQCQFVSFGQNPTSMSPAINELLRRVYTKTISTDSNPILKWNVANVVPITDAYGNLSYSKKHAKNKIDALVALTMACGRAMLHNSDNRSIAVRI
jgi:phage terminase large subunit-like protein